MSKVLLACEESQAVCKEFRKLGHEAYSCDLYECSGGHPEWHIKGDCLPILNGKCEFTTEEVIDYVDEAIEMKGYKYKSHYLAIRKWFKDKSRANSLGSGLNKKVKDTSTIDENGVISL